MRQFCGQGLQETAGQLLCGGSRPGGDQHHKLTPAPGRVRSKPVPQSSQCILDDLLPCLAEFLDQGCGSRDPEAGAGILQHGSQAMRGLKEHQGTGLVNQGLQAGAPGRGAGRQKALKTKRCNRQTRH